MIRILGVDPGTARIGWGIITQDKGKLTADAYGCITTPQHETAETRLKLLFQECTKIIKAHKPDVVSVEDLFCHQCKDCHRCRSSTRRHITGSLSLQSPRRIVQSCDDQKYNLWIWYSYESANRENGANTF